MRLIHHILTINRVQVLTNLRKKLIKKESNTNATWQYMVVFLFLSSIFSFLLNTLSLPSRPLYHVVQGCIYLYLMPTHL